MLCVVFGLCVSWFELLGVVFAKGVRFAFKGRNGGSGRRTAAILGPSKASSSSRRATSSSSSSYKFAPVSTKAGSNKATKSKASGSKGLRSVVDAFEQGV